MSFTTAFRRCMGNLIKKTNPHTTRSLNFLMKKSLIFTDLVGKEVALYINLVQARLGRKSVLLFQF